jgi:acid phosphatase
VKAGDDWLKKNLNAYANWAQKNNSLLIVTWDEDSSSYTIQCSKGVITTTPPSNPIATIVVGQPVATGAKSTTSYTHEDLLRTILDMYGVTPFGGASTATDITDIWK